jgi:hypothetical protein
MGAGGGGRGERLAVDTKRLFEGRRGVLLPHRSAFLHRGIAGGGVERSGVHLDFVAAPARRGVLVALAAPGRVEDRPEPGRRGERAVEHHLAAGEAVALVAREAGHGVARLHRLGAASEQEQEDSRAPLPGHGFGTAIFSMRSATSPAPVRRPSTRTTSPGLNSRPARRAAVPPPALAARATLTGTIR